MIEQNNDLGANSENSGEVEKPQRKYKGFKRYVTYGDIAEATGLKLPTVRAYAKGNGSVAPRFDPYDLMSIIEFVRSYRDKSVYIEPDSSASTAPPNEYDRRRIHACEGGIGKGEKLYAYSYQTLARLFDVNTNTIKQWVFRKKFNPISIQSIIHHYNEYTKGK